MSRFGADAARATVLHPWFFDVLHVDGRDLLDEPLSTRIAVLERIAPEHRIPGEITADAAVAERVSREALAAGHEGVVVKAVGSAYAAGRRGSNWIKVKPVHTYDLVVLACEWGSGRRTGLLSNLHLGALDPAGEFGEPGGYVMVGKTFKGLTDALLRWQTEKLPGDRGAAHGGHRLGGARHRGGDRDRRRAAIDALSGRHRAAVRPRQALPRRQDGGGGRHDPDAARRCCVRSLCRFSAGRTVALNTGAGLHQPSVATAEYGLAQGIRKEATMSAETGIDQGRSAFQEHRWTEAYENFREADHSGGLPAADLERLATAEILTGESTAGLDTLTRAHEEYLVMGDVESAARCAGWMGMQLMFMGERARAGGWFARGQRLWMNWPSRAPCRACCSSRRASANFTAAIRRARCRLSPALPNSASGSTTRTCPRWASSARARPP